MQHLIVNFFEKSTTDTEINEKTQLLKSGMFLNFK